VESRPQDDGREVRGEDEFIAIRFEQTDDDMIAVVVEDSGPGIPLANLDRLFEPFFTTKSVGKGTGLGLSLSYGMARDMGGRLEVKNGTKGAEFRLILRAAKDEKEGAENG
jgi:C4-dicarboxylate-specific signal transduction histidine kinase